MELKLEKPMVPQGVATVEEILAGSGYDSPTAILDVQNDKGATLQISEPWKATESPTLP